MTLLPNGSPGTAQRGSIRAILRGMSLIARGRAEGMNCFGDSPRAILGSLIPGFGLMAGAAVEAFTQGDSGRALGGLLAPSVALLAPSVLSHELARYWGREAFWGRYIVAFNWCQWLLPIVAMILITTLTFLQASGVTGRGGMKLLIVGLAGYALWLNWFVARHGLALSAGRAGWFVAGVNLGTMALVVIPSLFGGTHK